MNNKKGFTLIELLATISIIAILATIIIPMSLNLVEKSNKEQCQRVVDTILSGAELCYLDKLDICNTDTSKDVSLNDLYINGYIEEEYKSDNTNRTISASNNYDNYQVNISITNGYPEYSFPELSEFCG